MTHPRTEPPTTTTRNPTEALTSIERAIDNRISVLGGHSPPANAPAVQLELARLMASYDRLVQARNQYLTSAGSRLGGAMARMRDPSHRESLRATIAASASDIIGSAVSVQWTQGPHSAAYSPYRILLSGEQIGVLIPATPPDEIGAIALHSFADLVSVIFELIALGNRHDQQSRLLEQPVWLLRTSHPSSPLPPKVTETPAADSPAAPLTEREHEVLALAITGASNQQIAQRLFVSVETVRSHMKNILRKYQVRNRAELIGRVQ